MRVGRIITFGGAYSNHIYATAFVANELNIPAIGIIRGGETLPLNHTLRSATEWGMELHYVSRTEYRKKREDGFLEKIRRQFGDAYIVPEGGSNALGVKGAAEIMSNVEINFSHVICSVGTGTMMAGILNSVSSDVTVIGYSSLKGGGFLVGDVSNLSNRTHKNWEINLDYHFGGYAKTTVDLMKFMDQFHKEFQIELDPIYNGKMFYGLFEQIKMGAFNKGDMIVSIHCGGIQK